jgi:hypothetical protein
LKAANRRPQPSTSNLVETPPETAVPGLCSFFKLRAVLKYWEIIADNLSKAGWSWGCVSGVDSNMSLRLGKLSGDVTQL